MRRTLRALVLVAFAVAACKKTEPPKADAGTKALTFSMRAPEAIELRQGMHVVIELDLTTDGPRTEPAAITVAGASDGVTATVTPVDLEGRGYVELDAAADAAAGPRELSFTADGDGASASATTTVTVVAFGGVAGRVVDAGGNPVRRVVVRTTGGFTHTDDDGAFLLPLVTLPYDLDLVTADGLQGYRFVGLNRRDPLLTLAGAGAPSGAFQVEGTLTGAEIPVPADGALLLSNSIDGADATAQPLTLANGAFGPVTVGYSKAGSRGELFVLETKLDDKGAVSGFYGSGATTVVVANGQRLSDVAVALAPSESKDVTGSIQLPDGFRVTRLVGTATTPGGATFPVADERADAGADPGALSSFHVAVPSGFQLRLDVTAEADGGRSVVLRKSGLDPSAPSTLTLPDAPVVTTPETAGAPVAAADAFAWSDTSSSVYVASFGGAEGESQLFVVTADKTATIPDLGELGFVPPAGFSAPTDGTDPTPVTFAVAREPYATMDAATGGASLRYGALVANGDGPGVADGALAVDVSSFVRAAE